MARKTTGITIERGSGNVFADLGFPDPELYSVERLMEFLTALGHNVEVRITPTRRKQAVQ